MLRRNLVLSIAVLVACAWATSVAAHTSVRLATPGPGDTVSAPVDEVRIEFLDEVQPGARIELTDPSGEPVTPVGEVEHLDGGKVVVQAFEATAVPGDHRVDYRYAALDGAVQTGAYEFEVVRAGSPDDGFDLGVVAMAVTLVLVVVAGGVTWLRRR